jgi:hypothetical protein
VWCGSNTALSAVTVIACYNRSNAKLDLADLAAATARGSDPAALLRPLDRAVRQQLEPLWHTLNWRSRCVMQIVTRSVGKITCVLGY